MIEIHVYGKLRRYAKDSRPSSKSVIHVQPESGDTLESILHKTGIDPEEVYSIFLNAKLLATRNTMARWLKYEQIRTNPHDWDLSIVVKDGDRLGLFSQDMAALVV